MEQALARAAAWSAPWLASLVISISLAAALSALLVTGAQSTSAAIEPPASTCTTTDDRMLVYAVSTHRVPANLAGFCLDSAAPPASP